MTLIVASTPTVSGENKRDGKMDFFDSHLQQADHDYNVSRNYIGGMRWREDEIS